MRRRLKIVMDYDHTIKPDGVTNWVVRSVDVEWSVYSAIDANRETLVLQP